MLSIGEKSTRTNLITEIGSLTDCFIPNMSVSTLILIVSIFFYEREQRKGITNTQWGFEVVLYYYQWGYGAKWSKKNLFFIYILNLKV
jgi:hypothetical protein